MGWRVARARRRGGQRVPSLLRHPSARRRLTRGGLGALAGTALAIPCQFLVAFAIPHGNAAAGLVDSAALKLIHPGAVKVIHRAKRQHS